jgi:hypothetical protein
LGPVAEKILPQMSNVHCEGDYRDIYALRAKKNERIFSDNGPVSYSLLLIKETFFLLNHEKVGGKSSTTFV